MVDSRAHECHRLSSCCTGATEKDEGAQSALMNVSWNLGFQEAAILYTEANTKAMTHSLDLDTLFFNASGRRTTTLPSQFGPWRAPFSADLHTAESTLDSLIHGQPTQRQPYRCVFINSIVTRRVGGSENARK